MKEILKQIRFGLIVIMALMLVLAALTATLVAIYFFPKPMTIIQEENSTLAVKNQASDPIKAKEIMWNAPEVDQITDKELKEMILYGKELIANTSKYLGPKGMVGQLSNGMNCQNCHMDAGTKAFGNNYSAVFSTYPKFRARSGTSETIVKRISDCFERSLNGTKPDSNSKEMKAMIAYMKFLGTGIEKGTTPKGAGLQKLAYLDRAADPTKGAHIYETKCKSCHGANGEGILAEDKTAFVYPPLWGKDSYNDAAGLHRISNFAGYVKNNMPFGASYENQLLSDEEAWDIAAFVNSQTRPHKDQQQDWVDISKKPVDFPFGPYSDKFSESQHKFGPFKPIKSAINKNQN